MDISSRANRISVADVSGTLEKLIDQFDTSRGAGLAELVRVRAAKFNGVVRDRARLAAQLGAEDPRVAALDRSLALHNDTLNGFRSEIALSAIDPPRVDERGWAIHGNVYDTARSALPGLTVALYLKDAWLRDSGYACTDDTGYFVLTVGDAVAAADDALSLRLLRSENIVYTDPRPVAIHPAHVEYREIVVDDTSDICAPPVKPTQPPPDTSRPTSTGRGGARKAQGTEAAAKDQPATTRSGRASRTK